LYPTLSTTENCCRVVVLHGDSAQRSGPEALVEPNGLAVLDGTEGSVLELEVDDECPERRPCELGDPAA
jgi:hypothetical protein